MSAMDVDDPTKPTKLTIFECSYEIFTTNVIIILNTYSTKSLVLSIFKINSYCDMQAQFIYGLQMYVRS